MDRRPLRRRQHALSATSTQLWKRHWHSVCCPLNLIQCAIANCGAAFPSLRLAYAYGAGETVAAAALDCIKSFLLRGFHPTGKLGTCRLKVISENIFIASGCLKLYPTSLAETSLIFVNHLDLKDPFVRTSAKECARDLNGALDFDRQTPLYRMPGMGCRDFDKLGRAITRVPVSNASL
ncbi:hypothetical protein [Burkholderia multivorans]|uniref:hypothetical protein n=1 Tax=Burkholderia multivorans TaxID=87883 RepID=UPI001C221313|nr:hypothetical protein [Burkholderia multivorans]MBU9283741.1 hypothetical protein [Burkholderia multivorans]